MRGSTTGRALKGGAALAVLTLLALGACSSDSDSSSTTSAPATPTTPAGSSEGSGEAGDAGFPTSPLTAVIDQVNTDIEGLGVATGEVTAAWYQAGENLVVVYDGLDLSKSGDLCLGNSLETEGGSFEDASNSPTGDTAACLGFETLASAPTGVRLCGTTVAYLTAIPAGSTGTLWASIEKAGSASVLSMSGTVATTEGTPPTVDLDAMGCAAPTG